MADSEHPFIKARPPATDYLTYLTIIEYNLTTESLPVLHGVLQDEELTSNIGWDLIHLLLPLLPESKPCLDQIALLGNPREVVLKVTEALRLIDFDSVEEVPDHEEGAATAATSTTTSKEGDNVGEASISATQAGAASPPPPVQRYQVLLSLLEALHPRIKTKYPSRFLSSTLQAVLATYGSAVTHLDELTLSIVKLVNTLSGTKRPQVPPRRSSGHIPTLAALQEARRPSVQSDDVSGEDADVFARLLQSFLTHVLDHYLNSAAHEDDIPGLAWGSRLQEKFSPGRIVPGKPTFADRFAENEQLQGRLATVGQLVALAQDLELANEDLYSTVLDTKSELTRPLLADEEDPPNSAADVPLSKVGALYLLTARKVAEIIYESPVSTPAVPIFPDQALILKNFVDLQSLSIGSEPEALLDTLLTLGLLATQKNEAGEPADDEQFIEYLQTTSLISANSPSPSLRYNAHILTSTLLRSHPSDMVQLTFIRDTLEYCPYENLKASAVAWLKGETIEANPHPGGSSDTNEEGPSVFATPIALSTVSPFLFPGLQAELVVAPVAEAWVTFKMNLGFYLATLNFYYLLLSAKHLHKPLDIAGLHVRADIGGSYLGPLKAAAERFKDGLKEGGELYEEDGAEGAQQGNADLRILRDVIERVEKGVVALNVE